MTSEPDAKIIDLIQASAKEALAEGSAAGFRSLEFFPPRTDTASTRHVCTAGSVGSARALQRVVTSVWYQLALVLFRFGVVFSPPPPSAPGVLG